MYAIAFDMKIDDLKKNYGEPYNSAYDEIRQEMDNLGFEWTQGSLYISKESSNSLATVYKAINRLSQIDWFKNSVRDIRAFKVEDWSDFTDIVKSSKSHKKNTLLKGGFFLLSVMTMYDIFFTCQKGITTCQKRNNYVSFFLAKPYKSRLREGLIL